MKTKKEEITARSAYKRYTAQFKEQALERADRDGIPRVSQDLGLAEATLYAWRAKRRQTGRPFEDQKLQQAEMARLKRENARLEEEVAFLKKASQPAVPSYSFIIRGVMNNKATVKKMTRLAIWSKSMRCSLTTNLNKG
jgi:transposase